MSVENIHPWEEGEGEEEEEEGPGGGSPWRWLISKACFRILSVISFLPAEEKDKDKDKAWIRTRKGNRNEENVIRFS